MQIYANELFIWKKAKYAIWFFSYKLALQFILCSPIIMYCYSMLAMFSVDAVEY